MVSEFRVGVITTTHGVHGEVKVRPTTDDITRFSRLERVTLKHKNKSRVLEITNVKYFKNTAILKFAGLDAIEDVEGLRGAELWIPREDAVELEEGEYFIADVLGMEAALDTGGVLGTVTDVITTGANDVFEVRMLNGQTVLLPVIDECVLKLDPENGELLVHMMDGLL